jgi:hypothetical protein
MATRIQEINPESQLQNIQNFWFFCRYEIVNRIFSCYVYSEFVLTHRDKNWIIIINN